MFGIYINCSRYPFIDQILSGRKIYETRARDSLRSACGHWVYLIETGKGSPMVKGVAFLQRGRRVPFSDSFRRGLAMITGTTYDVQPGRDKVFYRLLDVQPVSPFPVPACRINHGRSYTEF